MPALSFERFQQPRFLSTDIRPGAGVQDDVEIVARSGTYTVEPDDPPHLGAAAARARPKVASGAADAGFWACLYCVNDSRLASSFRARAAAVSNLNPPESPLLGRAVPAAAGGVSLREGAPKVLPSLEL